MENQIVDNGNNTVVFVPVDSAPHEVPEQESTQSWMDYSRLLLARRKTLFRVAWIALVCSAVIALLIPSRYESTLRIMPPDSQNNAATLLAAMSGNKNIPGGLTSLAGNLFGLKNTSALFTDLLHSRTVQDHLVQKFNLQKVYSARYLQDARKKLASRTDVSEDRKSGVITIAVTDHDRQRARDMAQAYVDELDHLVASVNTSSAHRERVFIEQRLASVKQDLQRAEAELGEFSSKNSTLDVNQQARAAVESAAELQGQLIAAKSELESLQQVYSDNNIRVRSLNARIGELQRQLNKMSGTGSPVPGIPIEGQQNAVFPSLKQIPLLGVRWLDLYRNARMQETVFELLTSQYEIARIEEAKSIPVVRVIDPPDMPERKSFPPRGLITIGGTLLALACACGLLILRDKWHRLDGSDPRRQLAEEFGNVAGQKIRVFFGRSDKLDRVA